MKIINSILAFLFLTFAYAAYNHSASLAQTASILPQAETQFLDNNGKPVSSGTVDFYIPGSTTRKTTWQDSSMSVANTNPVTLDASGRALIYGYGGYRQILKDSSGNVIWDRVTNSYSIPNGQVTTGDGDAVGTVKPWGGLTAPTQYVFAYGQELSRTTYSDLFIAITLTQNVNCTLGSNVLTGIADTSQIPIGADIESSCNSGTVTVTNKTSNSYTVSSNAITSLTATSAVVFPFGNGNGSTTFNVPDLRGRTLAGRDNMGGIAASRLTSTYFANASAIGASGGVQSHTLAQAELPNVNLNVVIPPTNILAGAVNAIGVPVGASLTDTSSTPIVFGSYSSAQYGSLTFPGGTYNTTALGSGTAFSIVQPTMTLNYIIKVTSDNTGLAAAGVSSIGGMSGIIVCGANIICSGNVIQAGNIPYYNTAIFSTRADAIAANIGSTTQSIYLNGYYAAGDDGKGAIYIKGTASTPGAGFTSADGQDWKLANTEINFGMFGAAGDNAVDDTTAISNACSYANAGLAGIVDGSPGKIYKVWTSLPANQSVLCNKTGNNAITFNWNGSQLVTAFPFGGSSTSVALINTGTVTFTTNANNSWKTGDPIIVYVTNNVNEYTNIAYMIGTVVSYSGTTLVMNVTSDGGTPGTYNAWTFLPNVTAYTFLLNSGASNETHNDPIFSTTAQSRTYNAGIDWFATSGNNGTGFYVHNASLLGGQCGMCLLQPIDLSLEGFSQWHFDGTLTNVFYGMNPQASGDHGDFNIQTTNVSRSFIYYNVRDIKARINSTATVAGLIDDVASGVIGGSSWSNNKTSDVSIDYINKNSTQGRNMITFTNYASAYGTGAGFQNITVNYDVNLLNIVGPTYHVFSMGGILANGSCGDPNMTYNNFKLSGNILGTTNNGAGDASLMFLPQTINGVCGNFTGQSTGSFNIDGLVMPNMSEGIVVGAGAKVNFSNVNAPNAAFGVSLQGSVGISDLSYWHSQFGSVGSTPANPFAQLPVLQPNSNGNAAVFDKGSAASFLDPSGALGGIIKAISSGNIAISATEFSPVTDNTSALGDATHRFSAAYIASLAITCGAGNFLSAIAANGTPTCTSGSSSIIVNDAAMQGDLLATNIAAPSTPSAGKTRLYVDNTQKIFTAINDGGVKSNMVVPDTGAANNFLTGIGSGGTITKARPNCANLSDGTAYCSSAIGQLPGTSTNDNASAGNIGQYISSSVASGSAVALTNGVAANVTSISLTAGDWDVGGNLGFTGGSTTNVGSIRGGPSSTSATLDTTSTGYYDSGGISNTIFATALGLVSHSMSRTRFSLNTTTTIYLIARCDFTVSNCSAWGTIAARRVR